MVLRSCLLLVFCCWAFVSGGPVLRLQPCLAEEIGVRDGGDTTKAGFTVDAIKVEGLVRLPASVVLQAIDEAGLEKGLRVDEEGFLAVSSKAIKALFATQFFSDIKIYKKNSAGGGVEIVVVVLERFKVDKVVIAGNSSIETEDIEKELAEVASANRGGGLKRGAYFDPKALVDALKAIESLYQRKGYYLTEASYEVVKDEKNRVVTVQLKISEQEEVEIRKIVFVGNKAFSDSELRAFMATREKNYLSFLEKGAPGGIHFSFFLQSEKAQGPGYRQSEFGDFQTASANSAMDLERLRWLYMTRGYADVRFGEPRLSVTSDRTGMVITIDVSEGRQYTVRNVDIRTQDADGLLIDKDEALSSTRVKPGEIFNVESAMRDADQFTNLYKNMGYAYVNVANRTNKDPNTGMMDIIYVVQKGNPTYIADILFEGNKTTEDKVVRRELKVAEGDLYSRQSIGRSEQLVFRLGFFEKVEIRERESRNPPKYRRPGMPEKVDWIDLVVVVKERETGVFQVGAGFSSLESYLLQARVTKNNFLGRGQTLGFQALVSSLRSIYMVSFSEPYFLDTFWNFSIELYNTATDYEAFTTDTIGGSLSFGYRFLDDYYISSTYKIESMDTDLGGRLGFSGIPLERLTSEGLTTSLRLSVAWDTRNNRIVPTAGQYQSLSAEWATPYLGGSSDFYRLMFNSRWYIPLFWDFTLRLNGTLGYIVSNDEAGVPLFERFYLGGIFSVRGFQRNSLSPTIAAASSTDPSATLVPFPLGGNKEIILNSELEIPIVKDMGIAAVLFIDAGNAFAESQALDPLDVRTSWGFGFRWWSPMGPLRFEWGFPFAPRKGEDSYVFEFTIGSAF